MQPNQPQQQKVPNQSQQPNQQQPLDTSKSKGKNKELINIDEEPANADWLRSEWLINKYGGRPDENLQGLNNIQKPSTEQQQMIDAKKQVKFKKDVNKPDRDVNKQSKQK
jgi:hypothetical protein